MRQRVGGRGGRQRAGQRVLGVELTNPAGIVRPAVEAALEVARRGLGDDPPVVPPNGLRPYLGFTRLSGAALQAIARVVDGDDGFRARVAAAVDEDDVGRAGWLWLTRPDDWHDQLRALEDAADQATAAAADDREERDARRRLAAAQSAAERALAAARAQAHEIEVLRTELLDERSRRTESEARAAEIDDELDRVRAERARAVRELKEMEARLVDKAGEMRQLKAQLREHDVERERGHDTAATPTSARTGGRVSGGGPDARDRSGVRGAGVVGAAAGPGDRGAATAENGEDTPRAQATSVAPVEAAEATAHASTPASTSVPAAAPAPIDPLALTQALRSAARGAAELARALGELEAVVAARLPDAGERGTTAVTTGQGGPASRPVGPAVRPGAALTRVPRGNGPPARRVPVALPGGLLDDSVEAVEHLLRAPGLLLLVDGYNVTMTGWPELPVGEQRRRLLSVLGEAAARTGTGVEVVFDGADVEPLPPPHQARQLVRVRFSPPDIEADDVLLELLAQLPPARPVAVASSDNRVREGAKRQGANLVHARQLVALLRR